ncbi:MAG TPA: UDP-N-acetylglucosamine--N-acetylmuramyl-(pentapeptide) pyrophosphoryl-undecaprenol N-acetylglucosamine transferase [Treponema sp.]|nr:UDP-N-acetylglucosamine--N-acetylmuramyl-(pentapeptide) pyrophosphoryl-undecaprenol N-acetylglucosamine transferase [Treponema sp.]
MVKIAFAGGGTGGHIYPGLAVAERLAALFGPGERRFFWIGSNAGVDRSIAGGTMDFFGIPSGRLRRYFSLKTVPDFFRVIAGFFAARRILKRERPAALFSKGGFVSVPPCAAAASLGIPVFTHESDFSPGLATKINVRFARTVFTSYDETAAFFPGALRSRVVKTGNPVRSSFFGADSERGRAFLGLKDERILLVLGGSGGAREINGLIRDCAGELGKWYTVVHQTGPGNEKGFERSERYRPYPYFGEEMPDVLAAAELVVGRSGGAVWEYAALGKPMVLIPLSGKGTRGDQVENARFFEKAGAAVSLTGSDVNAENLVKIAGGIAEDSGRRQVMAAACEAIGKCDAASIIANYIKEFLQV